MKHKLDTNNNQRGFTLIEVVAVLIIIGIVAAVAMTRATSTRDYDIISQVEAVKAHLRLAQFKAMSSNSAHGVNFSSPKTYYFFKGSAPATPIQLPGEDNTIVSLTTKKSDLTINSAPQIITFDAYGSPGASNITITTNAGNIVITKNTGFIP